MVMFPTTSPVFLMNSTRKGKNPLVKKMKMKAERPRQLEEDDPEGEETPPGTMPVL